MLYIGYRCTPMSARLGSRQYIMPILDFCPCKHHQACFRKLIDCVIQHEVCYCPVQAFSTPGPSGNFTGICPKRQCQVTLEVIALHRIVKFNVIINRWRTKPGHQVALATKILRLWLLFVGP